MNTCKATLRVLFAHRVNLMIYLVFIGILKMSISWAMLTSASGSMSAVFESPKPRVAIIDEHDTVHMAHMDIHFGFSINGVAALHTKILEDTELHPFYEIYPEKLSNKTNGITFSSWIHGANPALASLLDDVSGTDWRSTGDLSKLAKFADDKDVLERLAATKVEAKAIMRQFMALEQGVVPPTINYHTPDPACDLDYTPNRAVRADLTWALSTNLGFGGHNAAIALRRYTRS